MVCNDQLTPRAEEIERGFLGLFLRDGVVHDVDWLLGAGQRLDSFLSEREEPIQYVCSAERFEEGFVRSGGGCDYGIEA